MRGTPVLEVDGLTKEYRPRRGHPTPGRANDHLQLTVRSGEVVALLGPNGAGKSTFLRQVAGQLLPTSGSIRVNGVDMVAHPRAAKEHLSAIPQECDPIENVTVEEHVRCFGLIKGLPRAGSHAAVERLLGAVGLLPERKKLVRELSGGLKRRVLIATAMAGGPRRLMLLDEPTTGLDPEARRSVWKVIESLRSDGLAVLLTTHYIDEAEYLADRVVIIVGGRWAASGTPEEIRGRMPFRGRLDVRHPSRLSTEAKSYLAELERLWKVALRSEGVLRFEIPDPFSNETVARLAELTRLGAQASLSPVSLEDAYLSMVGTVAV